jgi:aspartokinase
MIFQNYGGTSVGTVERIKNVARRALATQKYLQNNPGGYTCHFMGD